jgi:predicted porin
MTILKARTLLAAAGAVVAAASFAPLAHAQTQVTVYGVLDEYIQVGKGAGTTTKVESGGQSGSRLGFKGQEELGGGLKSIFLMEHGVAADTGGVTQGGVFWGRQIYVGLASTQFGSVTLGRQYNLVFTAVDFSDPFSTGLGSLYSSGIISGVGGSRLNNSAIYQSPNIGPVVITLQGALGEGTTGKQYGADIKYVGGPLTLGGTYTKKDSFGAQTDASSGLLSATYDFGFLKLMGEVQEVKNLTQALNVNDDRTEYALGAQIPFGPHLVSLVAGQGKFKDVANSKATEVSLGYQYTLSKRTNLYVVASNIKNGNGTALTANGATGSGPVTVNGQDVRAAQFGIRHRF